MLCSKTKFFRSVLVVILAISLVGGLVVFRGFSLDENEGSLEGSSVVTEVLDPEKTEEGKNDSNVDVENEDNSESSFFTIVATDESSPELEKVKNDSNVDVKENSTKLEEVDEGSNNTEETEDLDNDDNANTEELDANEETGDTIADEDVIEDSTTGAVVDSKENPVCAPGECPENPIFINSADDLIGFFEDLKEGNTFSGKYIVLGNDIMITKDQSKVFAEILKEIGVLFPGEFDGYLNGNGYVIFIEFEEEEPAGLRYLFEQVGENAAVIWVNVIFSAQQASSGYTCAYTFTSFATSFAQVN